MPLRIVFMGTPDFAVPTLLEIEGRAHEIVAVYTRAAKPAGRRGLDPTPSPVERAAQRFGLPVLTPSTLRTSEAQAIARRHGADVAVVVAYGLILPLPILEAFPLGAFNLHASLLPRWRGAAPIQRAILAGDRESGITIMQMDAGLDTGPILLRRAIEIGARETGASLHGRLAPLGAASIVEALAGLAAERLQPTPQPVEGATYAAKLTREEERLDWREPAALLDRRVRALSPRPGAWCEITGERVKILEAEVVDGRGSPGRLLDERLTVACGEGALRLLKLQRAGKAALPAEDFLRGFRLADGATLA
jgi:methionyl-tRNA formyltransferase